MGWGAGQAASLDPLHCPPQGAGEGRGQRQGHHPCCQHTDHPPQVLLAPPSRRSSGQEPGVGGGGGEGEPGPTNRQRGKAAPPSKGRPAPWHGPTLPSSSLGKAGGYHILRERLRWGHTAPQPPPYPAPLRPAPSLMPLADKDPQGPRQPVLPLVAHGDSVATVLQSSPRAGHGVRSRAEGIPQICGVRPPDMNLTPIPYPAPPPHAPCPMAASGAW